MKALREMTPTDKAALLHDLFPEAITPFIDYLYEYCASIEESLPGLHPAQWQRSDITLEAWLEAHRHIKMIITKAKVDPHLVEKGDLLAAYLFIPELHPLTTEILLGYVGIRHHADAKFTATVHLLFDAEK